MPSAPGDLLELAATHGLNPDAVGRTRLRVGEGIVGLVAASGTHQNVADAPSHPAFAYRPETGEDPFASLLAVPVRRGARLVGVLAVQNRAPRRYADDEVEVLETVALLLAEVLAAAGATDGAEQGLAAALPRQFQGSAFAPGLAIGPVVVAGGAAPIRRLLSDNPGAEAARLDRAVGEMRTSLDDLIANNLPEGDAPREVLEATRLVAGRKRLDAPGAGQRGGRPVRRGRHPPRRQRAARTDAPGHGPVPARAPGRHGGPGGPPAVGAGGRGRRAPPSRRARCCWPAALARRNCWNGTPAASAAC